MGFHFMENDRPPIIPLGTKTKWGKIAAVGFRDGERYYMMIDKHGSVALMPAEAVEESVQPRPARGN